MTAGQDYFGEILLGPTTAPTALTVPVKISRTTWRRQNQPPNQPAKPPRLLFATESACSPRSA
jgi:hypothetical protein